MRFWDLARREHDGHHSEQIPVAYGLVAGPSQADHLARAFLHDHHHRCPDLVAGDFNGTAWRCRSRDNISTIDEVFSDCALPTPPGPTPLWGPGSIPNNWADVCGFLKPPGSQRFWKENKHSAFSIPRQALGLRSSDQSCHHETWLHLHFVDWNNKWNHQAHYNGNICLKERPASSGNRAQKRSISEVLSDHSLSSRLRNHLRFLVPAISLAHHHEVT